ncbi:uncharacterized protein BDW47DRAFT_113382, partial [Aspergillus candidus]
MHRSKLFASGLLVIALFPLRFLNIPCNYENQINRIQKVQERRKWKGVETSPGREWKTVESGKLDPNGAEQRRSCWIVVEENSMNNFLSFSPPPSPTDLFFFLHFFTSLSPSPSISLSAV